MQEVTMFVDDEFIAAINNDSLTDWQVFTAGTLGLVMEGKLLGKWPTEASAHQFVDVVLIGYVLSRIGYPQTVAEAEASADLMVRILNVTAAEA